jgi:hypothetical protein
MELYLGQVCESRLLGQLHRLQTVKYTYTLTPSGAQEPLFRWEYVRDIGDDRWCRHHLQGPLALPVNDRGGIVSLNDWHLPTGYVPFEEVLRFCVVDLGVTPLAADWHEVLRESYERFKADFTQ